MYGQISTDAKEHKIMETGQGDKGITDEADRTAEGGVVVVIIIKIIIIIIKFIIIEW